MKVHMNATESPFLRDETHFLEASYFDSLLEREK